MGWDFTNQAMFDEHTERLIVDSYVERLLGDEDLDQSDWKLDDAVQGKPKDPKGHTIMGCQKNHVSVLKKTISVLKTFVLDNGLDLPENLELE